MERTMYRYESLVGRKNEIRLLRLFLDADDQPLRGHIEHVRPDCLPKFCALSYVWGDPQTPKTILLQNDQFLGITLSLAQALHDVRTFLRTAVNSSEHGVLYANIWADAICINQADLEERSEQVMLMGSIYAAQTGQVVIYTGPDLPGGSEFPGFLEDLGRWIVHRMRESTRENEEIDTSYEQNLLMQKFPQSDQQWRSVTEFFNRDWPTRAWILQEFLLARGDAFLMYGSHKVKSWLPFVICSAIRWGYMPDTIELSRVGETSSTLIGACLTKKKLRSPDSTLMLPLERLLSTFQTAESSDPRDKIYAFANVASDWNSLNLIVDYSMPIEQVYTTAAARILQRSKSLLLLSAVDVKSLNLPSWVADHSRVELLKKAAPMSFATSMEDGSHKFSAGGPEDPVLSADEVSGTLTVKGAIIDRVYHASDILSTTTLESRNWRELTKMLWPAELQMQNPTMTEATWLTLIGGLNQFVQRTTADDFREYYEAWIQSVARHSSLSSDTRSKACHFRTALSNATTNRRFVTTEHSYMGLALSSTRVKDLVCIIQGAQIPFIIREQSHGYQLIGECYIHGIMDGEALESGSVVLEDITFI